MLPLSEVKPVLKEVMGYEVRWGSFREYVDVLRSTEIGINIVVHVGRNTVRAQVMGRDYRRKAKPEEVEEMKELVEEAMGSGAIGLSTGLDYEPGAYADTEEVVELARVVARYGGVYSTHWRRAGVRVEVSHLLPGYVVYPDSEEVWRAQPGDPQGHREVP